MNEHDTKEYFENKIIGDVENNSLKLPAHYHYFHIYKSQR